MSARSGRSAPASSFRSLSGPLFRPVLLPLAALLTLPFTLPRAALRHFLNLQALSRHRRDLARLEGHLLDDIGITPAEAERESGRAFWDAPRHWRQ